MNKYMNISRNTSVEADTMLQYIEPQPLHFLRLVCFSLVILSSLAGNAAVIRAVLRAKGLKSSPYLLICNLAFAEIVSACCLPLLKAYTELHHWPFSQTLCHLVDPLQITAGMVVTTSIACIAFVRCLLIVSLRLYRVIRRTSIAGIMCLAIWMLSFICVLPQFLNMTIVSGNKGKKWCLLLLPGETFDQNYPSSRIRFLMIVQFLINYGIPLAVTLVCYSVVASKLKYRRTKGIVVSLEITKARDTSEQMQPESEVTEINTSHNIHHESRQDNAALRVQPSIPCNDNLDANEVNVLKMFYAIVVIFYVCYLPYQSFILLEYMEKLSWNNWKYFDITRTYLFLLTCFPSALHPLCYGLMCPFYHKAFTKLILCK